jgi:hypothetical protein
MTKYSKKPKIILSAEHRRNISIANKGRVAWNKGKTGIYSEETLQKIRNARKKQVFSKEAIRKRSLAYSGKKHWLYGKHHSEESIEKINSHYLDSWDNEIMRMDAHDINPARQRKANIYYRSGFLDVLYGNPLELDLIENSMDAHYYRFGREAALSMNFAPESGDLGKK